MSRTDYAIPFPTMTTPAHPQPLGGNDMPRFAGIATFMRLPGTSTPDQLDAAVVGVPFDIGTSNRPGARFGPRGIRNESVLLRPYNMATRAAPFDSLRIDDLGDVATNPYNVLDSVERIQNHYDTLLGHGLLTATMGGDHTIVLPILRAMAKRHGPVGLVHVDAHTDINDTMFGESHRPRHAVQARCRGGPARLRPRRPDRRPRHRVPGRRLRLVASAGIPCRAGGGMLASQPRSIDGRDPRPARRRSCLPQLRHRWSRSVVRPGTGTPEIGGLTIWQGMEIIRGCQGLDVVGCDVVEVAPIYDVSGMTSLVAANLIYEMLCVFPGVEYRR